MRTYGFAGTAKNTGKTTTILSVLSEMHACGERIGLTSIGYDGEQLDTITGLSKPRYKLMPGDLVATATDCLKSGTAQLKVIRSTPCQTILGHIIIAEIVKEGTVLVAGPNRQKDLAGIIPIFAEMGIELLLVDGALNRLVPMILCDGVILSTGAAFSEGIERVAQHISTLVSYFQLPSEPSTSELAHCTLVFQDGSTRTLPASSLYDRDVFESSLSTGIPLKKLIIGGIVNPALVYQWVNSQTFKGNPEGLTIVMANPLKMIASGHTEEWKILMENPFIHLRVMQSLPLICLTVNPFFPRKTAQRNFYEPAFVNKMELLDRVRTAVPSIPIFDLGFGEQPEWSKLLAILEEEKCRKTLI